MAHFVKKVFDCRHLRVEIVQIMCLGRGWLNSLPCHLGHAKKPLAIARTFANAGLLYLSDIDGKTSVTQ